MSAEDVASDDANRTREMAKYGIVRVPVDFFHWGEYRSTRLEDAIAQAKRTGAAARTA